MREYNDYLELIEDTIFNLVNGTDVKQTKRQIQEYREANQDHILKNRHKKGRDRIEMEDLVPKSFTVKLTVQI